MTPHPSVYIVQEMEARGWSRADLAQEMRTDPTGLLALDLYLDVGPTKTTMRLGQRMAEEIAKAFDVPAELLLGLERAWLRGGMH